MSVREQLRLFLMGMGSITIFPIVPEIELGDISDDWNAVGNDIRNASRGLTSKKGGLGYGHTLNQK